VLATRGSRNTDFDLGVACGTLARFEAEGVKWGRVIEAAGIKGD